MKKNEYGAFMDILLSDKSNRIFADVMMVIIAISTLVYLIVDGQAFDANALKDLSGFALTVILAITALGISVLQTSDINDKTDAENKRKYLIKYVFSTIKDIVMIFLGFMLAMICKEMVIITRIYCFIIVVFLVISIRNTIFLFMSYFEIKSLKNTPNQ